MSGEEEEIGTLIVVVLKAQNLNDKHFFKQDVYAQVSFNGTTKKTRIDVKGGQHPFWDSELRFPVMKNTAKKYRELDVSCFAKEHKDDSLLGEAKVDMTATLISGEFDEWVPLQVNDVQRGDIYLEITYYSNGPAPPPSSLLAPPTVNLGRRPSKMSPADRLYRPVSSVNLHAAAQQQQQAPRHHPKEGTMPGSYPPAAVPSTLKLGPAAAVNAAKPGPAAVPSALKPGAGVVPNALKPGPVTAPGTYTTGPTRVSPKQQQQPLPATSSLPGRVPQNTPAGVPSILRPGIPQSDPQVSTHRRSSASPPRQSQLGYTTAGPVPYPATHTPNPYTSAPSVNYFQDGAIPYTSSTPVPSGKYNPNSATLYASAHVPATSGPIPYASSTPVPPSNIHRDRNSSLSYSSNAPVTQPHSHRQSSNPSILGWNSDAQSTGSFSFPVPNFPGAPSVAAEPPTNGYGNSFYNQPYLSTPPPAHQRTASFSHIQQPARTSSSGSGDLPDPYLIARYQTPLPLPPETQVSSSSSPYTHRRSASAEPTTYRPTPPLPAHPTHPPSPPSHNLNVPQSPTAEPLRSRTPVDESRLRALRHAEQEAARRREQEEKDAELARMLDQAEADREERERVQERERQRQRELKKSEAPPKSDSPPPYVKAEADRKTQEEKDAELARQLDRELNL
ncbi:hypothetical protein J3R30DRAFT_3467710 [Lentinula aciculospora]|uniref:C2 domain-containing protein n=1 Tax=Lentinula aciculospora TaxID=153920 RepID=A0A9W9DQG7_9AGAR|nr:hypothetical protein J3R30DRAFT_3467710 [Lentinula aciculospora]